MIWLPLAFIGFFAQGSKVQDYGLMSFKGIAPTAEIGTALARSAIRVMMGPEYLANYEPLQARLYKEHWIIRGRLGGGDPLIDIEPFVVAIDKGSGGVALFRRYVDEKTIERQVREVVEHNRQIKAMTQGLTVKAINLAWKSHLAMGAKPNDLAKARVHLLDVGSVYRIAFTNLKEVHERAEAVFRVDTKTWKVTTDPGR